ncbi:hypothetical protein HA466_0094470 [Hirschfeldia incana]|nr:hypothetical protein HA466_0094470 [Hirschfeldia incana]
MEEAKKKKIETSVGVSKDGLISALGAFVVYLIIDLFFGVGFWVAGNIFYVDLVTDPSLTLFLLWTLALSFRLWQSSTVISFSLLLLPRWISDFRSTYPQSFPFSSEKLFGLRYPQEELKRIIVIKPCLVSCPTVGEAAGKSLAHFFCFQYLLIDSLLSLLFSEL